jgi:hypothetical protein
MSRLRRRLLAGTVALLALGTLAGPALRSADAHGVCAEAYTYKKGSNTRHYVVGSKWCVPFSDVGWPLFYFDRTQYRDNGTLIPDGTTNGGGVAVWVPAP